jgi:signal peptidase I
MSRIVVPRVRHRDGIPHNPGIPPMAKRILRRRTVHLLANLIMTVALLFTIGWAAAAVTGHRVLVVSSGSMQPALRTGDLILSRSTSPATIRPGEIITFRLPGQPRQLITHRVVEIRRVENEYQVVTKGDANQGIEQWTVAADGMVGRTVLSVRGPGTFFLWVQGAPFRTAVIVLVDLVLAGVLLRWIWSRP